MSKNKIFAFITAFSLLISLQGTAAFAATSAPYDVQTIESESLYEESESNFSSANETDEQIKKYMTDWYRPQKIVENGLFDHKPVLGTIEKNGSLLDYYNIYKSDFLGILRNRSIMVSVSNAVTQPGKLTFADISFDGYTNLFSFLNLITYDPTVMTLVSASISDDIPETYISRDNDITDFCLNRRCVINYLRNSNGNSDFSGVKAIRLCFKVHDDAPEGIYTISVSNVDGGGATGYCTILDSDGETSYIAYVPAKFTDGSITISKTAEPETNLSPKPFRRTYAASLYGDDYIIGDADGSGKINVKDLSAEKKYLLCTDSDLINTDVNEDGKANVLDLIRLSNHLLNK